MHNIIEIEDNCCTIWHIHSKKGTESEPSKIVLPEIALTNPQLLADLMPDIPKGKILFLLNIKQSNVSLLSDANIPNYFNSNKYISSHAALPDGRFWLSSIPANISECLLEMCRIKKIRTERILSIDTLEYRIANYYIQQSAIDIWLFLPIKLGTRLIIFDENGICSYYFFSNNPEFREKELSRICRHRGDFPSNSIILSNNPVYDWLHNFDMKLNFDESLKEKIILSLLSELNKR